MHFKRNAFIPIILSFSLLISACSQISSASIELINEVIDFKTQNKKPIELPEVASALSNSDIPEYSGFPYIEINDNLPFFTASDLTTRAFEEYSPLDSLGRCGAAFANICQEVMPTKEREYIGMVKPSGWHTTKYDFIDGKYLYNRCHLIGYQLAGENANNQNLITGTRFLNASTMLPFENLVANYVKNTDNHVLYRVTPIFNEDNLLATGLLMEGYSVEDKGVGICFNVFCYNVQPGVIIDYSTGESYLDSQSSGASSYSVKKPTFIANIKTKKFHTPDCKSVQDMNVKNKFPLYSTIEEALSQGFLPCSSCIGPID